MTITTSTIAPTAVLEPTTMLRGGDESGLDTTTPTGTNDSTSEADNSGRCIVDKKNRKMNTTSSRGRSITNVASYKDNDNSESEDDGYDEDVEDDRSVVAFRQDDTDIPPSQPHLVDALSQMNLPDPNRPYFSVVHWQSYGHSYWIERGLHDGIWYASQVMASVERALRDNEEMTEDVNLKVRINGWGTRHKAPYHPDLLPSWEEFVSTQVYNRSSLKTFRVDEIELPPSPFLEQKLLPMLRSQSKLYSLELRNCGLKSNDFTLISGFIQNNTSLSILDLSSNVIGSVEDANCLSTAIANHAELSFVNLSRCGLGVSNPIRLELMLNGCKKLKSLIIDGNLIHGASLSVVADFLTVAAELTVFSMDNYRSLYRFARKNMKNGIILEADDVKVLSRALKANTSLRQLCLGRNGLRLPSFMSKSVIKNLTHLDLSGNEMRSPGAKVVAQFLSKNRTLTELNLADNQIPSAAASALGAALKRNTTLEHLDLSSNSFTDKCVPAFGKFNPTLKYWRVALPCIALTTPILCS
jgi:Ran GTPase-activating protein (RanGAP) involved in mRNA processing and transport